MSWRSCASSLRPVVDVVAVVDVVVLVVVVVVVDKVVGRTRADLVVVVVVDKDATPLSFISATAPIVVVLFATRRGETSTAADFVDAVDAVAVAIVVAGKIDDCRTGEADERNARTAVVVTVDGGSVGERSISARSANNDCKKTKKNRQRNRQC